MRQYIRLIAFIALLLICATAVGADIPRLITYQGRLTDDIGIPIPDGTYNIDFAIYDDSISGSSLWGEIHSVTTIDGLFSVQLGLHSALDESIFIDHADLFLRMQIVGSPEMSPRSRIASNAFCYQALHADMADYALAAVVGGGWRDDGTIVRLDDANDSVGIGTSVPAAKLDVIGDAMIRGKTTFGTNQTNTGDGAAIGGGAENIAEGMVSTIGGGQANLSSGDGSTISGGAGNIASNSGATVGGGFFNFAHGRGAVVAGGGEIGMPTDSNSALGDYSVISGGRRNVANGFHSVIAGGDFNSAGGHSAIISGGVENIADGPAATIAGGGNNRIYVPAVYATIGGGSYNRVHGAYSVVAGGGGTFTGDSNAALGVYSAILGGRSNTAVGEGAVIGGGEVNTTDGNNTVVAGGELNQALASSATVCGGDGNTADGIRSTVSGGGHNHAEGSSSAIVGGSFNHASGDNAFIGGGQGNFARGSYSVIGGGGGATNSIDTNSALGNYSVIGGGAINTAGGQYATIGGGGGNTTDGEGATVAGGISNDATAYYTTVAGGYINSATMTYAAVGGGSNNEASGDGATVPGGAKNTAYGSKSFAAGYRAKALHDGTFVWADNTEADFQSTGSNKFLIRASGGVGIGTISPGAMLDVADDDHALRLRAGNGQAEYTDNQILLSYGGTVNYSHAIKSRHSGSSSARNAIDFYVWDQAVDGTLDVGSKHVMTIDGDGSGEVGIGTDEPKHTLDVRGEIGNNGTVYHSDRRWKMDVRPLSDALGKVQQLQGVSFEWKCDEFPEMNFSEGTHIGLIAQEVEEVLPDLVVTDSDGYKSVAYANLIAVLVEAVKEQQDQLADQQDKIAHLAAELEKLKSAQTASQR